MPLHSYEMNVGSVAQTIATVGATKCSEIGPVYCLMLIVDAAGSVVFR
jgi:hypothetical protein